MTLHLHRRLWSPTDYRCDGCGVWLWAAIKMDKPSDELRCLNGLCELRWRPESEPLPNEQEPLWTL